MACETYLISERYKSSHIVGISQISSESVQLLPRRAKLHDKVSGSVGLCDIMDALEGSRQSHRRAGSRGCGAGEQLQPLLGAASSLNHIIGSLHKGSTS